MPTDVISKVGQTNSPTTMDYSTLQAWEDACPANLVTADQRWIGECYDQGTFTGRVTVSGQTTDATRYVILRCATGASFADKAGVRTTALTYNESNGVSINPNGLSDSAVRVDTQFTQIDGLQIRDRSAYANASLALRAANTKAKRCIFYTALNNAAVVLQNSSADLINCLLEVAGASPTYAINHFGRAFGCTIVRIGSAGGTAVMSEYSSTVLKNCAVFGFSTFSAAATAAGSDYNATDLSSASTGSHNATSLTYASQFTNSASDYRAASGGGLHAGTPDSTNTPADITSTTRDLTTPWIGCWENVAAPGGTFNPYYYRHLAGAA